MDSILRVYILFSSLRFDFDFSSIDLFLICPAMDSDMMGKESVPERKWEGVLEVSSGSGYVFSPLLALAFFFFLFFHLYWMNFFFSR